MGSESHGMPCRNTTRHISETVQLPHPPLQAGTGGARMRFYFPDSQDQIDPSFDFITEETLDLPGATARRPLRARGATHPSIRWACWSPRRSSTGCPARPESTPLRNDNASTASASVAFFRLDREAGPRIDTLGDCGGFTYVRDEVPPYTPDEVIDFYDGCGFDLGISIDHVILGYDPRSRQRSRTSQPGRLATSTGDHPSVGQRLPRPCACTEGPLQACRRGQGWSPASYATAVQALQRIGYTRIALGGMVPLKDPRDSGLPAGRQPRSARPAPNCTCWESRAARTSKCSLPMASPASTRHQHFGSRSKTTRTTSTPWIGTYTALRVPQVDGNPKLKARIRAGQVPPSRCAAARTSLS